MYEFLVKYFKRNHIQWLFVTTTQMFSGVAQETRNQSKHTPSVHVNCLLSRTIALKITSRVFNLVTRFKRYKILF